MIRRVKRFLRQLMWMAASLLAAWALIDPTDFTRALDQFLKTRANLIIAAVILFLLARWVWRELKKIFK